MMKIIISTSLDVGAKIICNINIHHIRIVLMIECKDQLEEVYLILNKTMSNSFLLLIEAFRQTYSKFYLFRPHSIN